MGFQKNLSKFWETVVLLFFRAQIFAKNSTYTPKKCAWKFIYTTFVC